MASNGFDDYWRIYLNPRPRNELGYSKLKQKIMHSNLDKKATKIIQT